ncbi:hypothetical protein [Halopseudomonas sp.]
MKFAIALMLSLSALTCTLAQAENGSERLHEFFENHQQMQQAAD